MLDFKKIRLYPIKKRRNKFTLEDMIPLSTDLLLDHPDLERIAQRIVQAKNNQRPVIVMIGGAVIKVGCSALIIDLIKGGFITHIALNGGASIHDFELAMIGATSEDVPNGLEKGTFGMAAETLTQMNTALKRGHAQGHGYGESVARWIEQQDFPYREHSILYSAYKNGIKATVHIAIGGDIIHQHPGCDGATLGQTSFTDFQQLTETVSDLKSGILLNIGSAVNLPEVFLKALTIVRNLGYDAEQFTTANFDFLDLYRPRTRIVEWPRGLDCEGFDIRENHTRSIPTLYRLILKYSQ